MKYLLTHAPVLKIFDLNKEYTVCIDASYEGFGEVLMQEEHIICYESWKLKENEKNYLTHDIEIVEVVHALKM